MKIAVIGANGQLGSDLCQELNSEELVPLLHKDFEVADIDSVKRVLFDIKPDVVINTAAFHRVDDCEKDPDTPFRVNAIGARNVAVITQEIGARLVFISTDYVFGGESEPRNIPYTEFDSPVPPNIYGQSKLAGEQLVQQLCLRHFIIRASGLFGVAGSSGKGQNFIETMLRLARERDKLTVVNDQVFSPTYTADLSEKIAEIIRTDYYGVFHVTGSGACSWYELAREALRLTKSETPIMPITSAEYPQAAKRPSYSVMDNYQLRLVGMDNMRSWQNALQDYLVRKKHISG